MIRSDIGRLGILQCSSLPPHDGVLLFGPAAPGRHQQMQEKLKTARDRTLHWLRRTPVQTFILCPLIVIVFELVLHQGRLMFVPWGAPLLVWGYLQYLCVGSYRLPRAGGTAGMDIPPERMITQGPYRFTRNPMYLGHLIFMFGLTLTFWSWLAFVIFIGRAYWFHQRVLHDEVRLEKIFGAEYAAYRAQVRRWIPSLL